ncbi:MULTISPECIES: HlyD family secretion protein [unclassified Bradyrhizobium]|uniref:efflux RND transporter periplasmic adaptor subunit n=1 Tax=unclassified Bradyrhizobium TaxID=2631580 RepID=UPI001FFB001E|nr:MULTISPECIES: HlyD family secretion protein [unclassified Bradyrhizobium]MCK1711519.1 HlyD family efflux transporter periplasmic adaptor subunit [Bradyrhizobium sp. 143]MCK1731165.1 HlyD family efflux transporter periplasmic adaptor subunit [Bradyrhizobium sp. 142]
MAQDAPGTGGASSTDDAPQASAENALWTAFAASETTGNLLSAWLALQCVEIGTTRAAALLLPRPDGSFGPAAVWPGPLTDVTHLAVVAERALSERRGITAPAQAGAGPDDTGLHIAYPIESRGEIHGVVVVDAAAKPGADLQRILRRLHWGAGWIEGFVWRNRTEDVKHQLDVAAIALEMLAVADEHDGIDGAALALVNELAQRLNCERVAFGMLVGETVKLGAMSNAAWFQEKADLVAAIENAMEEAYDQAASVVLPPLPEAGNQIAIAHAALMKAWDAGTVASIVMRARTGAVGVLTFERTTGEPFDAAHLDVFELVGSLVGPVLKMKADSRRLFAGRVATSVQDAVRVVIGPRHPAAKLGAIAAALAVAVAVFWQGEFRITAKSVLEGSVQRAAVSPFQGFIQQAPAKAGDVVAAGAVLAVLDDRDLRSDVMKWESERQKNIQRGRDALAKHDRAGSLVAAAQLRQAEAELALATDKLSRTRITAPIDGLIVSGDLSQLVGTPVEQGKVLFEIAPLSSYRVVLQVSEFDIGYVSRAQRGLLSLTGAAGATVPFEVERITPVSTTQNGRSAFRVEALLGATEVQLRPGMEGVAKLSVGEASLFWIWTRGVTDRLRLLAWEWTP